LSRLSRRAAALCALLAASPAGALELGLEALWARPEGRYRIELFDLEAGQLASPGPGLLAQGMLPAGQRLALGLGAGLYRAGGGELFRAFEVDAELLVLPVHALGELRLGRRWQVRLQQGLGVTSVWLDAGGRLLLPGLDFDLDELDRSESSVSLLSGIELAWAAGGRLRLHVAVRYHQTFTSSVSENVVRFVLFGAGARWGKR
jgi:hypothetical protein